MNKNYFLLLIKDLFIIIQTIFELLPLARKMILYFQQIVNVLFKLLPYGVLYA